MARAGQGKSAGSDGLLTDNISLGVLAGLLPRDLVDEVVADSGRRERRVRLLPAHVMVYYVLAMCLFFDDSYEEVMRKLVGGLRAWGSWDRKWGVPSSEAISNARERLGPEPLEMLFERVAVPMADRGLRGAWTGSRRLMAIDGFSLDLQDTPGNIAEFGYPATGAQAGAFPQAKVVGLAECGTHALVGAKIGPAKSHEKSLAVDLVEGFEPGMLITADRAFYSYDLWDEACESGADLLWRVKANIDLPVLEALGDGSYISVVFAPQVRRKRREQIARIRPDLDRGEGRYVRVVEYEVPNRQGRRELFCLITTVTDYRDLASTELAAAYHERWEVESLFDEAKTHQRGSGRILRSKKPGLVTQEIWALLLTHYAIRDTMRKAAEQSDVDPDRLSFVRSLRVVRRQVIDQANFSPWPLPGGGQGNSA